MNWTLEKKGFSAGNIADDGNRFLVGNGYMGIRGTPDEFRKDGLAAVNLAGIYDKAGDGWREPLNAPNPLYTCLEVGGRAVGLPTIEPSFHIQSLDFRYGVMSRKTTWQVDGTNITFESSRFASLCDSHIIGARYRVTADSDMDVTVRAGIDGDVWDIYGPHYGNVSFERRGDAVLCCAKVQNSGKAVAVARKSIPNGGGEACGESVFHVAGLMATLVMKVGLKPGAPFEFDSLSCVFTTNDAPNPAEAALQKLSALESYDALLSTHKSRWDEIWRVSEVEIGGDGDAERAINYSLYHLNCAAPKSGGALSIPARGLSGQTYKGAIFWDTEIFMLDYFLHSQPEVARGLVKYRIETLPGAMRKAESYGLEGAFYAWESQEGGFDACSDHNVTDVFTGRPVRTYFRDKQVHISSAVVWAIMRFYDYTGDVSILADGGARVILECARFYLSLLVKPLTKEYYELRDVIGPDEYHERVNNNAYTNRMALYTFDSAIRAVQILSDKAPDALGQLSAQTGLDALLPMIEDARAKLYIPRPDENGIIEQFDGYLKLEDATLDEVRARLKDPREYWGGGNGVASGTQIIKQADVVAMLEMFRNDYSEEILRKNWEFYEPRTEHGSSLSACMYAMLACRFARPDLAYPFFLKSAKAEINGGGKQWAGLVYIGGTHPAAAGGAWKVLAQAFAGLSFKDGAPALSPCLPAHWSSLKFPFLYRGVVHDVAIDKDGARINARMGHIKAVIFDLDGVLVSTDELHFKAWQRLASELGITSFTKEDNLRQRGVSRMESLEIVLKKSDTSYSDAEKEEFAARKNSYYVEMLDELSEESVLAGAIETLKLLRSRGVLTAVGSASKNAGLILEKTGLKRYFDAVADGFDTARSKPDPQVFEVAARKLNVSPEFCIVVEDADAGITAGIAAGMKTLGVGPAATNPISDFSAKSLADETLNWDKLLALAKL